MNQTAEELVKSVMKTQDRNMMQELKTLLEFFEKTDQVEVMSKTLEEYLLATIDLSVQEVRKANVNKAVGDIQKIQSEMANIVSKEIKIPAKIHTPMIGARGKLIQSIRDECGDVQIRFPDSKSGSDVVTVRGPTDDVEKAVKLLKEMSEEIQLNVVTLEIEVNPEHHPMIIGRRGAVIAKIRDDFDVQIQLPPKEEGSIITITGYEKNANDARDAILKIVGQSESMVHEEVSIDPRVHSVIIGKQGRSIRKIMDDFKVYIRVPREDDLNPSHVVISGHNDNVQNCIDHLKIMEEEGMKYL